MLNVRKSHENFVGVKMGLKRATINHSIFLEKHFKRNKMDENNDRRENGANNNNGTRAHTDFSIDKILSDVTPRTGVNSVVQRQRFYHPGHEYFNWNRRIYPPISIDVPNSFRPVTTATAMTASTASTTSESEIVNLSLRLNDRRQFSQIGDAKSIDYRHFYNSDVNALFTNKYEHYSRMYSIEQNIKYFGIDFRVNDDLTQMNNNNNNNNNVLVKTEPSSSAEFIANNISLSCSVCDKVFESAEILEAHERTHKSPKYKCEECGKGFSQLRNFKYHVSVHKGTKEFAAKCPECDKLFNDKGYLSSHLKIHRNKKEYACPHCPKSFNQRVAFNMHARM